ncbi:unnamed protein product [Vicia faba]|uniref:No apical meristem-associated C-terminal domain-containing protein n=1 Tax=Vicia faba TaxID=3906 RepID=A0AAV1A099_VICFA|nr:unnamed protein product [Vicia faba]
MFNYMSNYQNPNPQNSQFPSVPTNPAIFFPETLIGFMSGCQVPPVSTQVGTEKEERDPIVGVDQKAESFWLRIAANYNQYRGQSRKKLGGQLKCRWHRINGLVQKFVGCYKQAVNGKKSGTSKNDIMVAAHTFFAQDEGTTFNLDGASSDNPNTPSSYEFNSSSPMERPMGQKEAKRKGKEKEIPNAMQDARIKRAAAMERLAQCKEDKLELKAMNIIMKDTSTMNDNQRDIHEKYCNKMEKEYGM